MKKYFVVLLVLLGLGSCYYGAQHNKKTNEQEMVMKVEKNSELEIAKAKIDSFSNLTNEEKNEWKNKLEGEKDSTGFSNILLKANKLNWKNRLKSFATLNDEQKLERTNKLEAAKNMDEFNSTLLDYEKTQAKLKIDTFSNLTNEQKLEWKNKIDVAKNIDEFNLIFKNALKISSAKTSKDALKENTPEEDTILVNFKFDDYNLSNSDKEKVKSFIKNHNASKISIVGHTDEVDTEKYNQRLSEKRAEVVANYLKNVLNVTVEISYSGKGELNPISNSDAENRRAEIKVIH